MRVYKVYVDKIFDYKKMIIGNILDFNECDASYANLGAEALFSLELNGFFLYPYMCESFLVDIDAVPCDKILYNVSINCRITGSSPFFHNDSYSSIIGEFRNILVENIRNKKLEEVLN
jgi:hypothetical protein